MQMLGDNNNELDNFRPYENEKSRLQDQDIEKDHRNSGKSSDTRSYRKNGLSRCIPQDELLIGKLLSFLRQIRFSEHEFL